MPVFARSNVSILRGCLFLPCSNPLVVTKSMDSNAAAVRQGFNYLFYIDFVGPLSDPNCQNALRHLQVKIALHLHHNIEHYASGVFEGKNKSTQAPKRHHQPIWKGYKEPRPDGCITACIGPGGRCCSATKQASTHPDMQCVCLTL